MPAKLHQLSAFYHGLPSYPQVAWLAKRVQHQIHCYFSPPQCSEQAHPSHAAVAATVRALAFVFLFKISGCKKRVKAVSPSCCQQPGTAIISEASDKQQMNSLCLPEPSTLTPALLPASSAHNCNNIRNTKLRETGNCRPERLQRPPTLST